MEGVSLEQPDNREGRVESAQEFIIAEENAIDEAIRAAGTDEERVETLDEIGQTLTFATASVVSDEDIESTLSHE